MAWMAAISYIHTLIGPKRRHRGMKYGLAAARSLRYAAAYQVKDTYMVVAMQTVTTARHTNDDGAHDDQTTGDGNACNAACAFSM